MSGKTDSIGPGYGGNTHEPNRTISSFDVDEHALIVKASLPVMIALFSTVLTEEFGMQYRITEESQRLNTSSTNTSFSWMTRIFELAEVIAFNANPELGYNIVMPSVVKDAVTKSTVAMSTLFSSCDKKINLFTKRLSGKYNDKHARRIDFYTMVVMLALCFFPYLKHRILGDLFNTRTLVIMCFDKTLTKHSKWSTLSTCIHMHVNQPDFIKRVLSHNNLDNFLPVVVTVTLEKYISDASCSAKQTSLAHIQTPQDLSDDLDLCGLRPQPETPLKTSIDIKKDLAVMKKINQPMASIQTSRDLSKTLGLCGVRNQAETQLNTSLDVKNDRALLRKRKTPCTTETYEMHEGRLAEKVMCL